MPLEIFVFDLIIKYKIFEIRELRRSNENKFFLEDNHSKHDTRPTQYTAFYKQRIFSAQP